ncbi:MAG: AAA-like domain-containing protein [Stenomitos rutilans HA7619-LM2]|jgi:hypothetical protein|nr:AAA-like domain-containing protein [Stenomitos rutilans HA7619-LM2]
MNTFQAGGPLNPNEARIAIIRREEFDRIIRHAINESLYIALNSPRQTGKATLLNQVRCDLHGQGYGVAFLDFSGLNDLTKSEFYATISSFIREGLEDLIESTDDSLCQQDITDQKGFFRYLEWLCNNTPGQRRIILMFYGIGEIPEEASLNLFPTIRSFFTRGATSPQGKNIYRKIMFIFAGDIDLGQLMQGRNSPLLNICETFSLRDFSLEQVLELAKGFQGAIPELVPKIANSVYDWTNGHPYLTQRLFELIEETDTHKGIDVAQIPELINQLVKTEFIYANNSNLNHVFNYLKKNTKSYCDSVFNVLDKPDLKSVYHDLDLITVGVIIRKSDSSLAIRNKIYELALKNFFELEQ